MASIASLMRRLNPESSLSRCSIEKACRLAGYGWRSRCFDPVATVRLMMLQVLHGNCSCQELMRVAGITQSATAYCRARKRLPLDVLGYLVAAVTQTAKTASDSLERWHGHRVLMMDGSSCSMPDTPELRRRFHLPGGVKPGCGFPVMHNLWLMDLASGLIRGFTWGPWNTHDLKDAGLAESELQPGDVVVGDRAFGTFIHFSLLQNAGLLGVFRVFQNARVDFRVGRRSARQMPKNRRKGRPRSEYVRRLGKLDQLVVCFRPKKRPSYLTQEQFARIPREITLRELRYRIVRPGFRVSEVTLVTSLLDAEIYTKDALAELYRLRWRVETNIRDLKQTMGMDVLRCCTVDGVTKELWSFVLVYNLVRLAMIEAGERQQVDPMHLSFKDTLNVLRYCPEQLKRLSIVVNPDRPGRDEPRVIKRRKDTYRYMTRPREVLRQELGITRDTG